MIGSFTLIKNEAAWIAGHLHSWLHLLDQMVFFDGNSTDGTLEIIEAIKHEHPHGYKVKLVRDKDPKDLQDDYVRLFNECMWSLDTDFAFFLHPDMMCAEFPKLDLGDCIAASVRIESFAGEPDGELFRIVGRGEVWKNIYRLRNPDLGAHYWGHYGHAMEDVYFRDITGDEHVHHAAAVSRYPYVVKDSGIRVLHFSDVRPPRRRFERMVKCLLNNDHTLEMAEKRALRHPRVTLKGDADFAFEPAKYPADFISAKSKYQHLAKEFSIA